MTEPNIRLSESALVFAESKATASGLDAPDDFVEALVQKAMRSEKKTERLERLLMEGINSGPSEPMDWDEIRRQAIERAEARAKSR